MNMNTTEARRGNTKATDELGIDGRQKKEHPLMSMRSMGDMGHRKTLS